MQPRTKPDSGAISRYRRKIDNVNGEDSEYDSEGGTTTFRYYRDLGKGCRDKARLFRSDKGTKKVVMKPVNPNNVDTIGAKNKACFYKTIYPSRPTHYFEFKNPQLDYRLEVDYFPGDIYEKSSIDTSSKFITYYLAAVRALRACHDKGRVVVDLKFDNMLHVGSLTNSTTYLIDGGTSRKIGEPLSNTFYISSYAAKERAKELCWHYAPECWFTGVAPLAHVTMDIYSLAKVMGSLLPKKSGFIYDALISPYIKLDPGARLTLDELEKTLLLFQNIFLVIDEIESISTDFNGLSSRKEINDHSVFLQEKISKLLCSDTFLSNFNLLGMPKIHNDIHDICYKKSQEIKQSAGARFRQITNTNEKTPLTEAAKTALRKKTLFTADERGPIDLMPWDTHTTKKVIGKFDPKFSCIR